MARNFNFQCIFFRMPLSCQYLANREKELHGRASLKLKGKSEIIPTASEKLGLNVNKDDLHSHCSQLNKKDFT